MMNKKKVIISAILASCSALLLTSCVAGGDSTIGSETFNSKDLTIVPVWDLKETNLKGWSGDKDFVPNGVRDISQITAESADGECTLKSSVGFTDSWKQNRGDEFNSFDVLYEKVGKNIVDDDFESSSTSINDIAYAVGSYKTESYNFDNVNDRPEAVNVFAKTAIRVFSDNLFPIPGYEELQDGENVFGSDSGQGLATVEITLECSDKESLNKLWKDGASRLILSFVEPAQQIDSTFSEDISSEYGQPGLPDGRAEQLPDDETQLEDESIVSTDEETQEEVAIEESQQ